MFKNGMVAVAGAALVLGSVLVVTDASAAGRGGHGARAPVAKAGGQSHKPTASQPTASQYTSPNGSGANFGMSGPFIGTKFIGNQ